MDFGGSMLWKVAKGWWQVGGIEQWKFGAARSGIQIAASGSHVIAFSFLHDSDSPSHPTPIRSTYIVPAHLRPQVSALSSSHIRLHLQRAVTPQGQYAYRRAALEDFLASGSRIANTHLAHKVFPPSISEDQFRRQMSCPR